MEGRKLKGRVNNLDTPPYERSVEKETIEKKMGGGGGFLPPAARMGGGVTRGVPGWARADHKKKKNKRPERSHFHPKEIRPGRKGSGSRGT